MKASTSYLLTALVAGAYAKDQGTYAVLRFNNAGGQFSTEGRMDPIASPGSDKTHSHGIMGGSNFDVVVEGDQLLDANCTNAKILNDKSNYWVPNLWFQSPVNGTFKKVPLFYMNVYYFFDATNDEIKAFPPGIKIMSGDTDRRTPPATGGLQLDPTKGEIQAVQWTCPTQDANIPRYPASSDGTKAGLQDPSNAGAGAGFPVVNCDGYASPLRQDIHMPSCYNPEAGLNDYKNNTAFPTPTSGGKVDCPPGWVHVPHLFFEVYYDTPQFQNEWTPDGQNQPFVLSNGDRTGYSSHADFISGWDQNTLQRIIDTCNAGFVGMDTCPDIPGGLNTEICQIPSKNPDPTEPWISQLPGDNTVSGWGV
ncbi:uncharacterized protein F4812DRAFT_318820 [Daldinia caldariorum]|uniref:uncharacterized protein n=1 Tax=Daldinia caldariorum TaxID=326644 RepID=UPI002007E5A1|nr:uncharacterized protein F4812DRAFT_318820 [Daldinia caldariorum]KAI1469083.1 hypothetical protein F4812DRAFT_318820 [Daldinia caldariorum]